MPEKKKKITNCHATLLLLLEIILIAQSSLTVSLTFELFLIGYRQALLAAQRHQPEDSSKRLSEVHHNRDLDDDKLLDVVGTSDSPLHLTHHMHHSGE